MFTKTLLDHDYKQWKCHLRILPEKACYARCLNLINKFDDRSCSGLFDDWHCKITKLTWVILRCSDPILHNRMLWHTYLATVERRKALLRTRTAPLGDFISTSYRLIVTWSDASTIHGDAWNHYTSYMFNYKVHWNRDFRGQILPRIPRVPHAWTAGEEFCSVGDRTAFEGQEYEALNDTEG